MKKRVLLLSLLVTGALATQAQVSLTGSNPSYTQDFNTLSNTGSANTLAITGWVIKEVGTSAQVNQQYGADDGSSNAGNVYSYGAASTTERALGSLLSSSLTPSFGASFVNNTGQNITGVSVTYKGEQWRRGNTTAGVTDSLIFAVSFDADSINDATGTWVRIPALHFWSANTSATAGALDGNTVGGTRTGSSPALIAPGAKVWIRWTDFNASGTDDGLAIDDFQASFTTGGGGPVDTLVRFSTTAATAAENSGSYNLPVGYAPTSTSTAFTAQVVLKSGNAANIGNYTTQTVNFPANTATATVPVTITDNALVDGPKTFVFALRNPSGVLEVGSDSLFTLTVSDDDAPVVGPPVYSIATVRGANGQGQPDSMNVTCELRGTVYGVNLRPGGLEFTINDGTAGIGVFAPAGSATFGYTVNEGDSIRVWGDVTVFRGLAQMGFLDTIIDAGAGVLRQPELVTTLGEATESKLVRLNGCSLLTPSQWTGSGSYNVDCNCGGQAITLRIHGATTASTATVPTGTFDVIGIGSQFATTTTPPFTNGYQLIPRKVEDILYGGSISENEASANLSVFPNPTDGRFFVRFESKTAGNAVVALKDLTGRTVFSKNMNMVNGANQVELNEELSSGIYLVTIQIGNEKAVKRVVVR